MRSMRSLFTRVLAAVLVASLATGCGTLSVTEEKRIGAQAQRQVRQSLQLMRDRVTVDYVRKLGEELVQAARPTPFELRFYVVEDESLNAFATFGGAIYVNTGIITTAQDVSELAGVIAHEIGHVTARHLAQNYRTQQNTGIVAQILAFAIAVLSGSTVGARAGEVLTSVATTAFLNKFTREFESEADTLAVETLINAGYDPGGMTRLFQTLQKRGGDGGIRFLQDHPTNAERIASVEKQIEEAGFPAGKTSDNGRLEIIQERIKLIVGTDAESFELGDDEFENELEDDEYYEGEEAEEE